MRVRRRTSRSFDLSEGMMKLLSRFAACWSIAIVLSVSAASMRGDEAIDAALAQARASGRPVLAVAGRQACVLCQALKERLTTDRELQPLLANFVPLALDVDAPAWQEWARTYPVDGNGLPFVYVVRADGEKLHGSSGPLQGNALPLALGNALQQSGVPLDPRQSERLAKSLAEAEAALAQDDLSKAIAALAATPPPASYAEVAVRSRTLIEELTERGTTALAEAAEQLANPETRLAGALALVETQRHFRRLPEIAKEANELKRRQRDAEIKTALAQATLIDKGRAFEEDGAIDKALDAYRAVADKYPNSAAADDVATRIAALEGGRR
ncbi:MAG TPA: hypothetical protein DCQ98_18365 [Planctomycetaceae bacterium]|nr:hypothetical protein [Planctomycetaceae bacterium]